MSFLIGELSRRTGVKIPTIRHYEQIGLLPSPGRTEGKQRTYDTEHLERLQFVRQARELGFEVDAVRELLKVADDPGMQDEGTGQIVRRHLAAVERRLATLEALKAELTRALDGRGQDRAGLIKVLANHARQ